MRENPVPEKTAKGSLDIPLVALNVFLAVITAATLLLADARINQKAREAALNANTFLTTEWRLLKEMKNRTDRLLRDKDREIAELRLRYEALKVNRSSAEVLAALEGEIRRAEAEREGILSARFNTEASQSPASPAPSPAQAAPETGTPPALPGSVSLAAPDTPVAALLREQIRSLETEIAEDRKDEESLERQIGDLRSRLEKALAAEASGPGGKTGNLEEVLILLEKDREALASLDPVLSLTDIKTRTLLRAIVRTPAIRAEYPALSESLDRYFDLYGRAERLKGKREAYDEVIRSVESLKAR